MRRKLSGPALDLFTRSGLLPEQVDRALEELVRRSATASIRVDHPIVQRIRQATALELVRISRRSRCLLIEIEQTGPVGLAWRYRELTPRNCGFSIRQRIPESAGLAIVGTPLARLVEPTAALGQVLITYLTQTADGWLDVDVIPEWHRF